MASKALTTVPNLKAGLKDTSTAVVKFASHTKEKRALRITGKSFNPSNSSADGTRPLVNKLTWFSELRYAVVAHPLVDILVQCNICTEFEARKYVQRLRLEGYDSIWALKSVTNMEGLRSLGIENKIHRIMLWRVIQTPGAIPDPNLVVSGSLPER